MPLEHQLEGQLLDGGVDERAGVARREEVRAAVVGEEELDGVKGAAEGKMRPAAPPA